MGFLDKFKRKSSQDYISQAREMTEDDIQIIREAVEKGTPCIPFIPIKALRQSMTVVKPEGLEGYFIARIPTLYEDGSIQYLYKEEFMLWFAIQGLISQVKEEGRTYFFLGLDQPCELPPDSSYIDPRLLYQNDLTLFNVEFVEELEFFRLAHSPDFEVTFIPADRNVEVKKMSVVNFSLVANLYPPDERGDISQMFEYYEDWKRLDFPTEGEVLIDFMHHFVQQLRDSIGV